MTVTDRRIFALAAVAIVLMALRACVAQAQFLPGESPQLDSCREQLVMAREAWRQYAQIPVTSCKTGFFYRMILVSDVLSEVAISDPAECTSETPCSYRGDQCPSIEGVGGVYALPEPSIGISLALGAVGLLHAARRRRSFRSA